MLVITNCPIIAENYFSEVITISVATFFYFIYFPIYPVRAEHIEWAFHIRETRKTFNSLMKMMSFKIVFV